MKILVLGSGGREHAIAWRCGQEVGDANVFLHPGNSGTQAVGFASLGSIPATDAAAIGRECQKRDIQLVVIGPEALLIEDLATKLRALGLRVVGPGKAGAQLESSKVFSKQFMSRYGIPTAAFSIASRPEDLVHQAKQFPCALKYDGLAAGKGVVIAESQEDVAQFANRVWEEREFGTPTQVLVEQFLSGREVSVIGFCDGTTFTPLPTATDYKRVGDADRGPNTGGMGAISPSPFETPGLMAKVQELVTKPLLKGLQRDGIEYRGILYIGLMVQDGKPWVLEFNTRFGDPETQALMLRIESGFVGALVATAEGKLSSYSDLQFASEASVYVVGAAENYPGKPVTGDAIDGIPAHPSKAPEAGHLFFSAVQRSEKGFTTNGGRVLGVGALGGSLETARSRAYASLRGIRWRGMHYRQDIGLVKPS